MQITKKRRMIDIAKERRDQKRRFTCNPKARVRRNAHTHIRRNRLWRIQPMGFENSWKPFEDHEFPVVVVKYEKAVGVGLNSTVQPLRWRKWNIQLCLLHVKIKITNRLKSYRVPVSGHKRIWYRIVVFSFSSMLFWQKVEKNRVVTFFHYSSLWFCLIIKFYSYVMGKLESKKSNILEKMNGKLKRWKEEKK